MFSLWNFPFPLSGSAHMGAEKSGDKKYYIGRNSSMTFLNIPFKIKEALCSVTLSCPTLCDPTNCSLPGSAVHGIFHAKIPELVATSYSRGYSWSRVRACNFCTGRWALYQCATWEAWLHMVNKITQDAEKPPPSLNYLSSSEGHNQRASNTLSSPWRDQLNTLWIGKDNFLTFK